MKPGDKKPITLIHTLNFSYLMKSTSPEDIRILTYVQSLYKVLFFHQWKIHKLLLLLFILQKYLLGSTHGLVFVGCFYFIFYFFVCSSAHGLKTNKQTKHLVPHMDTFFCLVLFSFAVSHMENISCKVLFTLTVLHLANKIIKNHFFFSVCTQFST